MGSLAVFDDDEPFAEKIKTLADEELLEIWVESQKVETMLNAQLPDALVISPAYEQVIVEELFLRTGRRLAARC